MFKYDKKLLAVGIIVLILIIIFFSIMILNGKSENQKVTQITNTGASNNLNEDKQKMNEFKTSFDEVNIYYQTLIGLLDLQNEVLNSSLTDEEKEIGIKYIDGKFNDNLSIFKTAIENLNIPNLENIEDKSKLEVGKQEMLKGINDISNKTFPDLSLKGISYITNVIISYLPNYFNNTFLAENKVQIKEELLNGLKQENDIFNNLDNTEKEEVKEKTIDNSQSNKANEIYSKYSSNYIEEYNDLINFTKKNLGYTENYVFNILEGFSKNGYSEKEAIEGTKTIMNLLYIEKFDSNNTDEEKQEMKNMGDLVLIGELKGLIINLKKFKEADNFKKVGDGIVAGHTILNQNSMQKISFRYFIKYLNSAYIFNDFMTLTEYLGTNTQILINMLNK